MFQIKTTNNFDGIKRRRCRTFFIIVNVLVLPLIIWLVLGPKALVSKSSKDGVSLQRTQQRIAPNSSPMKKVAPLKVAPLQSWFAERGYNFAVLGTSDGCRLTRGRDTSKIAAAALSKLCGRHTLRVLQWTPGPGFSSEASWRVGVARNVTTTDMRLRAWSEAVKAYLSLDATTYPVGMAPDNEHFFPLLPVNSTDLWASAKDPCGIPGLTVQFVTNNLVLSEAEVVVNNYPYLKENMYPPRSPGVLSVLIFVGESAENYPKIVAGSVRYESDITMGSPRGFFDIATDNYYTVYPAVLAGVVSLQLVAMRKAGGWPADHALVAMFVGHCIGEMRGDYLGDLMASMRVDSYGACFNNINISAKQKVAAVAAPALPCEGCGWPYRKEKLELFKSYPFAIAFENTNCYDYVTEKLYDVLLAGAVPIYMGAPNVDEWVPAGSYIDARQFNGPTELASYLIALANDPEHYAEYHKWRLQSASGDAFRVMRLTLDGLHKRDICEVFKLSVETCAARASGPLP